MSTSRYRGLDPVADLIIVEPRTGEHTLRSRTSRRPSATGPTLALVFLAGVNFATGQILPIDRLTAAAHDAGALVGWDLAHAAGNVPLTLHDDDVDFAAWCTYKYLNSGPGALGSIFIHDATDAPSNPRLVGWWGAIRGAVRPRRIRTSRQRAPPAGAPRPTRSWP